MAVATKHKWTKAQKRNLVSRASKVNGEARTEVYKTFATELGNGIDWTSVRAAYYAERQSQGRPAGKPKPKGAAKKTAAKKGVAKRKLAAPAGLKGISSEIERLEGNVASTQQANDDATAELAAFRTSLAKLAS